MASQVNQAFERLQSMTPAERVAHLKDQPVATEIQGFMDGTRRVGDPSAVSVKHRAVVRGVPVGGWYATPAAAIGACQTFLADWDGEL